MTNGWPAGVHHRVGHLERPRVDPVDDLDADRRADPRAGVAPRGHRRAGRRHRRVDVERAGSAPAAPARTARPRCRRSCRRSAGRPGRGSPRRGGPRTRPAPRRQLLAVDPRRRGLGVAGEPRPRREGLAGLLERLAVGLGQGVHSSGVGGRHVLDRTCVLQFGDTSANMCHMTNAAPGPCRRDHRDGGHGRRHRPGRRTGRPLACTSSTRSPGRRGRRRASALAATLDRLAAKGRISRDDADAATGPAAPSPRRSPTSRRAPWSSRRSPRTSPSSGRCSPRWRSVSRPTTLLATNTSSLDIDAIADGVAAPGARARPALLQPAAADAAGRGGARRPRPTTRCVERAAELVRAWGKTPVRCTSTPGLHRQPGRPPLLRRGPADGRGGRRRPRHHRRAPARAGRVPDGPPRADRPDRPGRQPRRRHVGLGADRPRPALRPDRLPAPPRRRTATSGARAVAASTRTTTTGRRPGGRARRGPGPAARGRAGRDQPGGPDPGHARQRGGRPGGARRGQRRGRRHRHAPGHATTRGGRWSGAAEIGLDVVAAQLAELDAAFPGGRYRPSPALAPPAPDHDGRTTDGAGTAPTAPTAT